MDNDLISRKWLRTAVIKMFGDSDIASNIDEIIDNAPTVEAYTLLQVKELVEFNQKLIDELEERPQGEWIVTAEDNYGVHRICCPFCHYEKGSNNTDTIIVTFTDFPNFCEKCGADMRSRYAER